MGSLLVQGIANVKPENSHFKTIVKILQRIVEICSSNNFLNSIVIIILDPLLALGIITIEFIFYVTVSVMK